MVLELCARPCALSLSAPPSFSLWPKSVLSRSVEEIYKTVELCKAVLGRSALSVYPSFKPDPPGLPFPLNSAVGSHREAATSHLLSQAREMCGTIVSQGFLVRWLSVVSLPRGEGCLQAG